MSRLVLAALALAALGAPATARAQDPFEIQVYDSATAPPGAFGLELHVNHVFGGTTTPDPDGTLPTRGVTHLTLEPHVGLAWWAELGGYLQTALRADGTYDYAGVKLRLKMRSPKLLENRLGLALNVELSALPRAYEAGQYGGEVRPIADFRSGFFYASVNPIVSFGRSAVGVLEPSFEPAAKVALWATPFLALGPEYYGVLGGTRAQRLFAALDLTSAWADLNLGVGDGFTGPEKWVVKAIVGVHPPETEATFTPSPKPLPAARP